MRKFLVVLAALVLALAGALIWLRKSQETWEAGGRERFPMRGTTRLRPDGRSFRVWCQGAGSPLIVLEASGLGGADQYEELMTRLAEHTTVCASDRAGFGYSDARTSETTIAALADDLWSVTEQRPAEGPIVLIGASYGGLIAQYAARAHPDDVGALILLDSVSLDAFDALEKPWTKLDDAIEQARSAAQMGLLRRIDPLKLGDTRDAWLTYRASTWTTTQRLLATRHHAKDEFAKLPPLPEDLPLFVIRHERVGDLLGPSSTPEEHAALEPLWQESQKKLAALSAKGVVIVAEGCGHLIAAENPDFAAKKILIAIEAARE